MKHASKFFLTAATLLLLQSPPAGAGDVEKQWTFGDWQVHIEKIDTGEDFRVTCTIQTVGNAIGKARRLYAIVTNGGDVLPPEIYPQVMLEEITTGSERAGILPGDVIDVEVDGIVVTQAPTDSYKDPQGRTVTLVTVSEPTDASILRSMRKGEDMVFRVNIGTMKQGAFQVSSLKGFTASYLKMAEQCSFPSADL